MWTRMQGSACVGCMGCLMLAAVARPSPSASKLWSHWHHNHALYLISSAWTAMPLLIAARRAGVSPQAVGAFRHLWLCVCSLCGAALTSNVTQRLSQESSQSRLLSLHKPVCACMRVCRCSAASGDATLFCATTRWIQSYNCLCWCCLVVPCGKPAQEVTRPATQPRACTGVTQGAARLWSCSCCSPWKLWCEHCSGSGSCQPSHAWVGRCVEWRELWGHWSRGQAGLAPLTPSKPPVVPV